MTTRMETVAEDVALTALRKASAAAEPPLQPEKLQEGFRARWPAGDSRLPMNDAMSAALAAAAEGANEQDRETWKSRIEDAWSKAVEETVKGYFEAAQRSFEKGQPLEGVETLTDTVRAVLGRIAATRKWPHSTHEDLYRIVAALATGCALPGEDEHLDVVLRNASEEGMDLCSALGASMGRPDILKFGVYEGDPGGPQRDGTLFAKTTIELANRLANQEASAW